MMSGEFNEDVLGKITGDLSHVSRHENLELSVRKALLGEAPLVV